MKRILLIEDDNGIREAIKYALEHTGYHVTVYATGNIFLEDIPQHPDLFIIDKQLSGVDGMDLCRHLRSQEKYNSTPVIIISASPQAGNLIGKMESVYFLEKPFTLTRLRDMVAQYLQ